MIVKAVLEPKELTILRCLNSRMNLSKNEHQQFVNKEKGFQGEIKFNKLLEHYPNDWLILNDLLFEYNHSLFQIDTLIITQKMIYLFEVKNFDGTFYVENKKWFAMNGKEIKDSLLQLKRCESLLRCLFKELKITLPIAANVVFINPEFTLYQAPLNEPIILPTQLNPFMRIISNHASQLSQVHSKLAHQLLSLHIEDSPYTRLPTYSFDKLSKGINCVNCASLDTSIQLNKVICSLCGHSENIETALLRSVKQYKLLFPEKEISTKSIYEWCGIFQSKKTIRRILSNHFTLQIHGRNSYYIYPSVKEKTVKE